MVSPYTETVPKYKKKIVRKDIVKQKHYVKIIHDTVPAHNLNSDVMYIAMIVLCKLHYYVMDAQYVDEL